MPWWTATHPAPSITSTGSVRPEGCQDRPDSPKGPMLECPVREPCLPKCCYPDMRRSNSTCEASGTTATIWEHQSGGGPAEDGRLNASERPWSRSVIQNQVLTGRGQKGMDRRLEPSTTVAPGPYRAQPPLLHIGQQGNSPRRREAAVFQEG